MIFCRDTEEESIFESKSMNHLTHLWRFTTVIIQNCNLKKFFYYRHKLLPCQYNILHMFIKTYFLIFLKFFRIPDLLHLCWCRSRFTGSYLNCLLLS